MTNQRRFFQRPHGWGLPGGLTRVAAQLFATVGGRIPAPMRTLRGIALRLLLAFAILLNMGLPEAQTVYADTQTVYTDMQTVYADTPGCSLTNGCPPATTFPAPELIYLKQGGLYAATAAQTASLRNIENQAIEFVLALHGLPPADAAAVRTWGRDDVLAQVYLLLVTAIKADAAARTVDQQNAVDWVTAMAKRRTVAAAEGAAREYVKWAGLGLGNFDALLRSNPTKAQLETFLSGTVVNFDNTNTALATEGWCVYRSPAPYADEYKGYNVPICINKVIGVVLPPTPTYDELVKWGSAKANYPLLSSQGFQVRATNLGIALGIAIPLGAVAAGAALYTAAAQAVTWAITSAAETGEVATLTLSTVANSVFRIAATVLVALTVIAALATAIMVGINVTDAAQLPGKLATLVDTARNTTPDVTTFISSTDATLSLLSIFVGATTPMPSLDTCDNSKILAPGMYPLTIVGTDQTTLTSSTPCLNPTAIPAATATDLQFLVTAKNTGVQTQASSITVKETAANTTTTSRLNGTWFITTANGATVQTLRLAYTDWDGKRQNAWLIGNATIGYSFLTYAPPADTSTTIDPKTCVTNGICGADGLIKYIGADGQQYSASVRGYQPPTGTPISTAGAEGSSLTLKANNFAPGGAVSPITYQWNFKSSFCNDLSCNTVRTATGDTVTHIWQAPGTYQVELIATDKRGVSATTRLQVPVSSLPPTLTFAPTCVGAPTATCNVWRGQIGANLPLIATIKHAGTEDRLRIVVNWGDGQQNTADIASNGQLSYNLATTHRYASAGVYTGTVTVVNLVGLGGDGGTIVRPFSMNTSNFPVVAWGSNTAKETSVPTGLQAIAVAGGRWHTLALKSDGTVVAWGCANGYDYGLCTLPAGLSGVMAISAASYHSLALKSDGTVVTWGCSGTSYGQCTMPAGLSGVKAVAAGFAHSLALKSDGTVVAWGCGAPLNQGQCTIPAGLSSVKAIATGTYHNLALKNDGTVVAWGGKNYTGERTVPAGLSNVVAIAAGGSHSLALKGDGTVVAWGDNAAGANNVPAGLSGVVAIAAGAHHNLALKNGGTIVAWGCTTSNHGQCTVPTGLSSIVGIGAGHMHSLALATVVPATGVAASAVAVVDSNAIAPTQPLTTTEVATAVDTAPAVVETTAPDSAGQSQQIFLPLVANLGTMAASDSAAAIANGAPASAATSQSVAVTTTDATTLTLTAVDPNAVTVAQPVTTTAPAAVITTSAPVSTPVTVAAAPIVTESAPVSAAVAVESAAVVTESIPVSVPAVVEAAPVVSEIVPVSVPAVVEAVPAVTDTLVLTTTQPITPDAAAVANPLAGTAVGGRGGIIVLLLVGLAVAGSFVWQRRRSRTDR